MSDPVAILADAMRYGVSNERYAELLPAVSACLFECECTTVDRIAMWMSQVGHESAGLLYMEELASGADYEWRSDLGNVYEGDGCRYKGRGPIMITGRANYAELSRWAFERGLVPTPTYFVDDPGEAASDMYGFIGVAWFWTTH